MTGDQSNRPGVQDADQGSSNGARIAKNTAILVTLKVLIPLLSVILMFVLSRRLGVDGVGRYTLAFGFLYFFTTIGPLGLYAVITRDGARDRAVLQDMLANAFSMGTLCSFLLIVMMGSVGGPLGYDDQTQRALLLLALAVLPYTLGNFLEGACVAIERTEFIAAATLAEYTLKVGASIALLLSGFGLDAVLLMAVLGRSLGCVVVAYCLNTAGVKVRFAWHRAMLAKLLRLVPTFLLISIFATLYWRIDILMLSKLTDIEQVGLYGAAWRLLDFAMVVPTSLCLALFPQISLLVEGKDRLDELRELALVAMRYLLALTLPVAVAVSLLGEHVLAWLYGEPFRAAGVTFIVLIWTLIPYCLVRYHAFVLIAAHRQRIDLGLNVIMTLVNVGLNLLLIPTYGHTGAAFATFCSIVIFCILQLLYVRRFLPGHHALLPLDLSVITAAAITAVVIWLLVPHSPWLAIFASPVVYLVTLFGSRFFAAAELEMLGLSGLLSRLGLYRWLRA